MEHRRDLDSPSKERLADLLDLASEEAALLENDHIDRSKVFSDGSSIILNVVFFRNEVLEVSVSLASSHSEDHLLEPHLLFSAHCSS